MNHLPNIENPACPQDDVPFLVTDLADEYNGPSLDEFPTHKGMVLGNHLNPLYESWTLYYATSRNNCVLTPAQVGSFFQSWLFFGPLPEISYILEFDVRVADFVIQKNGVKVCTTAGLGKLISRWAEAEAGTSHVEAKDLRGEKIHEILDTVEACVSRNLEEGDHYRTRWALSEVVLTSIQLVIDALFHAWRMIYPEDPVPINTGGGRTGCNRRNPYAGARLVHKRDRDDVLKKPHTLCNETKCLASQVYEAIYSTRHVDSDCECGHVSVDVERVKRILDRGVIPVIRIHAAEDQDDPIRLTVEESGKYVAFSQVWAQGLGNATANSLPICQLSRLRLLALGLSNPVNELTQNDDGVVVWIDTLCVPLTEGRKQALRLMGQTYSRATSVLVLGEELCHQTYNCSLEEICIRIFLCPWSRRLWTYKEAFLAQARLFVQFKEGAKSFSDLCRNDNEKTWLSPLLFHSIDAVRSILPSVNDSSSAVAGDILSVVIAACKYRTTSWLPDETFCIAETAGLAVESILRHDTPDSRMKAFLLQCREIPTNIVFFNGPKLQCIGFRWAPHSFLYPIPTATIFGGPRKGICTLRGLTASWPSFALKFPAAHSFKAVELYYFPYGDKWIAIDSANMKDQVPVNEASRGTRIEKYRQLSSVSQCVLILESTDDSVHSGAIISDVSKGEKCGNTGALVAEFVLNVVVVLKFRG